MNALVNEVIQVEAVNQRLIVLSRWLKRVCLNTKQAKSLLDKTKSCVNDAHDKASTLIEPKTATVREVILG